MEFWWQHARMPMAVFALIAGVLATTQIDTAIAHALFFDDSHLRWIGAGSWWTNEFLHTGGQWAIRIIAAAAGMLWILTFKMPQLRIYRRPSGYFFVAVVLSVGIVGLLKAITNVHCPWDLTDFGGRFPYQHLFARRPNAMPIGRCFPAAHAGCGYSLLALYFALRERGKLWGRLGIALGFLTGLVFGVAQQSRGAHFISHDIWSVFLVWMISLTVYAFIFKGPLWKTRQSGI